MRFERTWEIFVRRESASFMEEGPMGEKRIQFFRISHFYKVEVGLERKSDLSLKTLIQKSCKEISSQPSHSLYLNN